jgi:hypothetical protein
MWALIEYISFASPEDEIRSRFWKALLYSYLEVRMIDKVHKPIDSECYKPSSEPFRIYLLHCVFQI